MTDFTGQPIDNFLLSRISDRVGSVKQSMLDEATFNLENPGTWVLMDGRSVIGSEFETLTGDLNVPDIVTNGEFIRQAKAGRSIGSAEADDNKDHYHGQMTPTATTTFSGNYISGWYWQVPATGWAGHTAYQDSSSVGRSGGGETKPKNIAVNHFIKIDY